MLVQGSAPEWQEHFEFPLLATSQFFEAHLWDVGASEHVVRGIFV